MQTGLRHRLRRVVRQISEQHRHLHPIYAELRRALTAGDPEIPIHFGHYRDAIEAHFQLEGDVFFPALHGLHPEWSEELEALEGEHEQLRAKLGDLGAALEDGVESDAEARLDHFIASLGQHEKREERLVGRLQAP